MSLMAFVYGTPAGVVGSVSRPLETFVDTVTIDSSFTNYGEFGSFDATTGVFKNVSGSTTAVDGLLVRSVPNITGTLAAQFNQTVPNAVYVQGRMTRGYAKVLCTVGTPVRGGVVYVRVVADTGKAIGDIEATVDATPAHQIVVANAEWAVNGKDASNIAELYIKG